jgi:nucleotide-binding universal stress UspA family protein
LRESAEALVKHLSSHGVEARFSDWTNADDISAVEALFASVDAQECDLVVTGAFGHSRFYEALFGGVSFDLVRNHTLPLLMSH